MNVVTHLPFRATDLWGSRNQVFSLGEQMLECLALDRISSEAERGPKRGFSALSR